MYKVSSIQDEDSAKYVFYNVHIINQNCFNKYQFPFKQNQASQIVSEGFPQEKVRQSERLLTSAMNLWLLVFCNTDWSPQALKPGLGATGTKAGTTKTWRRP